MPDTLRAKRGSARAYSRRSKTLAVIGFIVASSWPARAASMATILEPYLNTVKSLSAAASRDAHQSPALALTLGILFFAVVTAILLVRTRARASRIESTAREEIGALRADL